MLSLGGATSLQEGIIEGLTTWQKPAIPLTQHKRCDNVMLPLGGATSLQEGIIEGLSMPELIVSAAGERSRQHMIPSFALFHLCSAPLPDICSTFVFTGSSPRSKDGGAWRRIVRDVGHAMPGMRACDRVDYGEKVKVGDRWRRNLVVQPNKGAKNEMLAKLSSPKTVLRMDYRRRYVAYRTCCAGEQNIVSKAVKRCSSAEREENEKRAQGNWDEAYGAAGREKVEAVVGRCTLATCIKHITEGPVESDPAIRD
ncbi:hypothetical protein BV25DRAFT_1837478 [Artomyces pyxidatus]|uniref:Uncharacterized protein n=1 Tax=Artomyces pyxidatus TaxID=48021 RepID=A0ACB8T618_9AGAM|nr:hypothetical protein BV25DRAFT_1837478 [Artomyces pyxidatus]